MPRPSGPQPTSDEHGAFPERSPKTGRFILSKEQERLYKRLAARATTPRPDLPAGI